MPDNVDRPILGLPDLLATAEGLQQALEMNYYIDDCKIPPGFPLDDPGFLFHHARMCAAAIKYAVIPNGLAYPNARESMRWLKNILRIILLEIGFDASELITQRKFVPPFQPWHPRVKRESFESLKLATERLRREIVPNELRASDSPPASGAHVEVEDPLRFSVSRVQELTGMSGPTVNRLARAVGVATAARGQKNFKYTKEELVKILEQGETHSKTPRLREQCKKSLAGLRLKIE